MATYKQTVQEFRDELAALTAKVDALSAFLPVVRDELSADMTTLHNVAIDRINVIDANTIEHLNRGLDIVSEVRSLLEAIKIMLDIGPPPRPDEPPPVEPPPPPTADYPWGRRIPEGTTLAGAVTILNTERNKWPNQQLVIEQIAWEIYRGYDPAWRSLPQGVRGWMEAAERRGVPPPA